MMNCPKWDECDQFKCHNEQVCLNGDYWAKYWGSKERTTLMSEVIKKPLGTKKKRYKENWKGICHYCERKLVGRLFSTRDHLIPIAQNGSNDPRNSVESCQRCNTLKGNRTPEQFANELGYWITEGRRGISKDTLIIILHNTRKLIFEIAPYRHELIKKLVVEPLAKLHKPVPIAPKEYPETLGPQKKEEDSNEKWLMEHYYPNLHPDPSIFHEK